METFRTIVMIGVPVTLGALFPDVDTAFGKHRKTLHNLPILIGFVAFRSCSATSSTSGSAC